MSEYRGKKVYKYEVADDPTLTTTTRNFEFRYLCSTVVEQAITKTQRSARETTEIKTVQRSTSVKPQKPKKPQKEFPMRCESDNIIVDTPPTSVQTDPRRRPKIRDLREDELEELILQARKYKEENRAAATRAQAERKGYEASSSSQKTKIYKTIECEEHRQQHPSWVEIQETPCAGMLFVENVIKPIKYLKSMDDMSQSEDVEFDWATEEDMMSNDQLLDFQDYDPNDYDSNEYDISGYDPGDYDPAAYLVEDSDLEYELKGRAGYTKYCGSKPTELELGKSSNDACGGVPTFIEMEPETSATDVKHIKNTAPMRYTDELVDESYSEQEMSNLGKSRITKKQNESKSKQTKIKTIARKPEIELQKQSASIVKRSANDNATTSKYSKSADSPLSPNALSRSPRQGTKLSSPRRLSAREKTSARSPSHSHALERAKSKTKSPGGSGGKSIEQLKVEKVALFKKMGTAQERIIEYMDTLRLNLIDIYVPERAEKIKRQKNGFEYSVRFSRNFLYPLKAMIDDLKNTSEEQLNSASSNNAMQRVSAIFALMQQSLQAYQKQLRYFLLDQIPQKLISLIEIVYQATNICLEKGVFDKKDNNIECLQDRCTKFIRFLEELHEDRFLKARADQRKMNLEQTNSDYDLRMCMNALNMYEPTLVPKKKLTNGKRKMFVKQSIPTQRSLDLQLSRDDEDSYACSSPKQTGALSGKLALGKKLTGKSTASNSTAFKSALNKSALVKSALVGETKKAMWEQKKTIYGGTTSSSTGKKSSTVAKKKVLVPKKTITSGRKSARVGSNNGSKRSSPKNKKMNAKTEVDMIPLNEALVKALQTVTRDQVRTALEPIVENFGIALDKKNTVITFEEPLDSDGLTQSFC